MGKEQEGILGRERASGRPSDTSFELLHGEPESWREEQRKGCIPYLGLDHVDPPGAEGLHTVVNVHDALTLGHVQHHIQNDVATCAASARTGERAAQARSGPRGRSRGPGKKRTVALGHLAMYTPHRGGRHIDTPSPGRRGGKGQGERRGEA